MSNGYAGEINVILNDIKYEMRIDIGSIMEFQSETGNDFMYCATRALNAYYKSRQDGLTVFDRSEIMCKAVSMADAATLFWVCAKRKNKNVEFGEFQEACLFEGAMEESSGNLFRSYALKFVQLAKFATIGIQDIEKKKKVAT